MDGGIESKGAVAAVKESREGFVESKGAVAPPAYRATRADKEKDKKEGLESKGAVAVKDGGMEG